MALGLKEVADTKLESGVRLGILQSSRMRYTPGSQSYPRDGTPPPHASHQSTRLRGPDIPKISDCYYGSRASVIMTFMMIWLCGGLVVGEVEGCASTVSGEIDGEQERGSLYRV